MTGRRGGGVMIDRGAIRARHVRNKWSIARGGLRCAGCNETWPCDAVALLDERVRVEGELDRLKADVKVGREIIESFFEALKPLQLDSIDVANPGRLVTELVQRVQTAESRAATEEAGRLRASLGYIHAKTSNLLGRWEDVIYDVHLAADTALAAPAGPGG